MKTYLMFWLTIGSIQFSFSQNTFTSVIKDSFTLEPLIGVSAKIKNTKIGSNSNEEGKMILSNIPDGLQTIIFNYVGFDTKEIEVEFPVTNEIFIVFLSQKMENLDEIIVQGTRSNRSIANVPTRVEVLTEEIDEAATMDPSKIAHLLTHSTGIQVQQTSATSNTANVRIQGLDGRYTQMLKDGFPLYGGFSGSLSIMQIPPLDLRQIEYIKGSASTLYGGGAISGLINLISKEPTSDETIFHINGSHIGAFDLNMFTAKKYDKFGFTLLAQRNAHKAFDADKDGFSDMPQLEKYNFNPKLVFYINDQTNLSVGGTFTTEKRQGGDLKLLSNDAISVNHFYKEKNDVSRITTQTKFIHLLSENKSIEFRNSFNIFERNLLIVPTFSEGEYKFSGKQLSSFSELSYSYKKRNNILIAGFNFYTDEFKETPLQSVNLRNEERKTAGGFVNYTFDIGKKVSIESGLRGDYVISDQFYLLPRASALFKWTKRLTTRIGGGLGYRNASIFNQEAELYGYKNVLAINRNTTKAEQSYGGNADIGYKFPLGEKMFINFNQMFFYTYLSSPLVLQNNGANFEFVNANGFTKSIGAETFFKFGFYDFVLFAGYTYTNATNHFSGNKSAVTLTPKHSLKGDLLYALPGKWRIGVDYELKSSQTLSNGNQTSSYWTYGAVVEHYYKILPFSEMLKIYLITVKQDKKV
ncbi:MAG: TonB-dependent receptor [Saprospiraceae bacterium]|nr:TonB-dependent receptor [Saprospiraceae bacterium]